MYNFFWKYTFKFYFKSVEFSSKIQGKPKKKLSVFSGLISHSLTTLDYLLFQNTAVNFHPSLVSLHFFSTYQAQVMQSSGSN